MRLKQFVPFILLSLFLLAGVTVQAQAEDEARGMWVRVWDFTTEQAIQDAVDKAHDYHFNQIYAHIRYRGDAYYYPNRVDDTYENIEPRHEYVGITPSDMDVLQTFIDYAHAKDPKIEIHAWLVLYPVTTGTNPTSPNHIYNRHPEWITWDEEGKVTTGDRYLDPGIAEVNEYLFDVSMDLVRNYDLDGIHFDYVRYDSDDYGYNPLAEEKYEEDTGIDLDDATLVNRMEAVWNTWRRQQVNEFVEKFYRHAAEEKPFLNITAAVVSNTGEDARQRRLQGYDYWVSRGFMDVVIPMAYSGTVSGMRNRYDPVAENVAPFGRHIYAGLGASYATSQAMVDQVNNLRALPEGDRPQGYVFYSYPALIDNNDAMFQALKDGPFSERAEVPAMDWKPDDTMPPNAPVISADAADGLIEVSWNRPSAAADGDYPVQYRIYAHSSSPVPLKWDNLRMQFHDADSSQMSFSWTDYEAPEGQEQHYTVVAFDDNNNRAQSNTVSATATAETVYIIETRSGGKNVGRYSETGNWTNSTAHSTAEGCTAGIGSRFSFLSTKGDKARFAPSLPEEGEWEVFVTSYIFDSANAPNTTVRIQHKNGMDTLLRDITWLNCGNVWYSLGTYEFSAGADGTEYVEFDDSTTTLSGSNYRLNPAAVRFEKVQDTAGWEFPEPAEPYRDSPLSPGDQIIADDADMYRLYEDGSGWGTSTFGNNYGDSKRFNSGISDMAVWVLDVPFTEEDEYWHASLEAFVTPNTTYSDTVLYRYIAYDYEGEITGPTIYEHSRSQNQLPVEWGVNIDGLPDDPPGEAHLFKSGQKVYVIVYHLATGTVVADAARLRILAKYSSIDDWTLY